MAKFKDAFTGETIERDFCFNKRPRTPEPPAEAAWPFPVIGFWKPFSPDTKAKLNRLYAEHKSDPLPPPINLSWNDLRQEWEIKC